MAYQIAVGGTTSLSNVVSARYHQLKRADWPPERSGLDGRDAAARECRKTLEALDRELVHAARNRHTVTSAGAESA